MLAALPLLFAAAIDTPATDCAALYAAHLRSDLELSVDAFDQTEGQGFRALAVAGCSREAGDLIEAWIAQHSPPPAHVYWHLAQQRAEHDDRLAAIAAARRSLKPDEAADAAFKWNDYVHATIAFLERDRTVPGIEEQHREHLMRQPAQALGEVAAGRGRVADALRPGRSAG